MDSDRALLLIRFVGPLVVWLGCGVAAALPATVPPATQIGAMEEPELAEARSAALSGHLEASRRAVLTRLQSLGESLYVRAPDRAARVFVNAYVFGQGSGTLLRAAESCQRAGMNYEALALFQHLARVAPAVLSADLEQRISGLRARLEDDEANIVLVAKEHINAADQSFLAGDFVTSWEELSLVYVMLPQLHRLLFNMAQSYRRAGRSAEAYATYVQFLRADPQSELRQEALGYLREVRLVAFPPPLHRRPWFIGLLGTASAGILAGIITIVVTNVPRYPDVQGGIQPIRF